MKVEQAVEAPPPLDRSAELRNAVQQLRDVRHSRDRDQRIFCLAILGVFVFFICLFTVTIRRFDQQKFSDRIELGLRQAVPGVLHRANDAVRVIANALMHEANRQLPAIQERLANKLAIEMEAVGKTFDEYRGDRAPALAAQYVDMTFRADLIEAVPAVNQQGRADKLLPKLRPFLIKRAQEAISEDLKPHLAMLEEIQDSLRRMQSEAKAHREDEFASSQLLTAGLDVLRMRLASGEGLNFENPLQAKGKTQ